MKKVFSFILLLFCVVGVNAQQQSQSQKEEAVARPEAVLYFGSKKVVKDGMSFTKEDILSFIEGKGPRLEIRDENNNTLQSRVVGYKVYMNGRFVTCSGNVLSIEAREMILKGDPLSVNPIIFTDIKCETKEGVQFVIPPLKVYLQIEKVKIKGIYYNLDPSNMTASVTNVFKDSKHQINYKGDIIIPEKVQYKGKTYVVNEIGKYAFTHCYELYGIILPSTITIIGEYAFDKCVLLDDVVLPNSLIEIKEGAFHSCGNIKTLYIPSSVRTIEDRAFSCGVRTLNISAQNPNYCFNDGILYNKDKTLLIECLENKKGSYTIPSSVKEINMKAFYGCSGLTSVTIPNSVVKIGLCAFTGCSGLSTISIPSSVTQIEFSAFSECDQLTRVMINSDAILNHAFSSNNLMDHVVSMFGHQVKEYIIGDEVSAIGDYAFYGCDMMVSVDIGKNVKSIGYRAFDGCKSLTSITVPEGVQTIGKGATFQNCTSLKKVQWNAKNCTLDLYESGNYQPPFSGSTSITEFSFGENVESVTNCLCFNINSLTSIVVPNSVKTIKQSAFRQCENLAYVTIGNSVNSIGSSVFKGSTKLKEIKYPKGLNLSKAEVPASTKLIAYNPQNTTVPQPKPAITQDKKLAKITWLDGKLSVGQYTFKVGINSESKIENVAIYVNGNLERGLVWVNNDGYDMVVKRTVDILEGQNNSIKVVVTNASGNAVEEKNITYKNNAAAPAEKQKRIALVMGNANYKVATKLKNPVNDATDIADKLEKLGFDTVIRSVDQTYKGMDLAIRDFGNLAKDYDVALFYYAGHGMQYDGVNYLIPVDADLHEQMDVQYENCVNMNAVLGRMQNAKCPMKIIILDACRNNPFRSWTVRGGSEGLCNMEGPEGTFIAFSTSPGKTALDGEGRNSPYTAAILQTLDEQNVLLETFFQKVSQKVYNSTKGRQSSWVTSSFRGDFYFNKK